ncbi:asparagine synthase-related protein, partial [Salmonella sp. SAL4436]|uniref:asparagine synthase-related protein n=1 Tax=Salmonella sp. SAL4436 TaxID=3159891 RepID=UPI00397C25C9
MDRTDRMTMGASIECRVPFLDHRLIESLAASPSSTLLSGNRSKSLLRKAVGKRLPPALRSHRKCGFAVPWASYFRTISEFRELIRELPDLE